MYVNVEGGIDCVIKINVVVPPARSYDEGNHFSVVAKRCVACRDSQELKVQFTQTTMKFTVDYFQDPSELFFVRV